MIHPMTGYIHVAPIKENISSIIHAEEKDTNRAVVISVGYGVDEDIVPGVEVLHTHLAGQELHDKTLLLNEAEILAIIDKGNA